LGAWGVETRLLESNPDGLATLRSRPAPLVLCGPAQGEVGRAFQGALLSDIAPGRRVILLVSLYSFVERSEGARLGFHEFLSLPLRGSHLRALLAPGSGHPPSKDVIRSPHTPVALSSHRLVLVEDNPVNQKVAKAMLARLGFQAEVAENGLEAVSAMASSLYDLILMDCQMPGMDGFEATRRIRAGQVGARRTPIVAMTANAMQGDRERCMEAGMDDYIAKPVTLDALKTALQRWLSLVKPSA